MRALRGALLAVAVLAAGACTYRAEPASGRQACAPAGGKRCPDGYYCAADDVCWRNGQGPTVNSGVDGGGTDGAGESMNPDAPFGAPDAVLPTGMLEIDGGVLGPPDALVPPPDVRDDPDLPPPVPAPSSRALVAGGTISHSATYRAVRTLGQAPGGNRVKSSATYRAVGGLVGATQR